MIYRSDRLLCFVLVLAIPGAAAAQSAPGVLESGIFTLTINAEIEASKGTFGDPTSIAPDFSFGLTDTLTLSALHSTFGRTGFRGAAGAGICVTDACPNIYDNAGGEATLGLTRGMFAIAANAGVHATSFDRAHYAAKAGFRMRLRAGELSIVSLPSVLIAVSHRDENKDRIFLPITGSIPITRSLLFGIGTGFKSPLDDISNGYEIALGAFVNFVASPSLAFAASYIHGKLLGGDKALPDDASGVDFRAIQIWVTITRSTVTRYARRAAMNRATSVHSASN